MDENTLGVMKEREVERELENERPCLFKSISPVSMTAETSIAILTKGKKAWSNANLTRLGEKIRSSLVL